MSNYQAQEKPQGLRSGFFDRGAFVGKARRILVLKTAVAGLYFALDFKSDEDKALFDSLVPGTELKLFREPDNEHDEWAIEVCAPGGRRIGYVTRYKNETIARLMDCGKVFRAYVDEPAPLDSEDALTSYRDAHAPTETPLLPFSIYMDD